MTHRNPALRHLETEPWASAPPPPVGPTPTLSSTEQAAHGRARGTEGVTARSGTFLEEVFGPEQGKNDSGWVGHSGWRYLARLAWPTGALHPRARNSRGPDWEEGEQGCGPAESGLPGLEQERSTTGDRAGKLHSWLLPSESGARGSQEGVLHSQLFKL